MKRALMRGLRRLRRRQDGVAAVEFALIAPVLLILLGGAANVGFRYREEARLNQATRETAEAAMFTRDLTALRATLTEELAALGTSMGGASYQGTVTLSCQCPDPAHPGQCAPSCGDGKPSAIAVVIEANVLYRPLFPLIGGERTLSSTLRVQVR